MNLGIRHLERAALRSLLLLILLSPPNSLALGGFQSLTGDERRIAEVVKSKLEVSEEDAYELYKSNLAGLFDTTDWQYDSFDNETLSNTKISKSTTRQLHFAAITDNRVFTVTFVKYMPERHVQIFSAETLPRQSNLVLERHESLKKETDYESTVDKTTFSSFRRKGEASRVKLLATGTVGAIMYTRLQSYDLKK